MSDNICVIKTWGITDNLRYSGYGHPDSFTTMAELSDNIRKDYLISEIDVSKYNSALSHDEVANARNTFVTHHEDRQLSFVLRGKRYVYDQIELGIGVTEGPFDLFFYNKTRNPNKNRNGRSYHNPSNNKRPVTYPYLGAFFLHQNVKRKSSRINKNLRFTLLETSVLDYVEKYDNSRNNFLRNIDTTAIGITPPWGIWTKLSYFRDISKLHYQLAYAGIDPYQVEIKIERKLKKRIPKNNFQSPDWKDWSETILPWDDTYLDSPLGSRLERIHYELHVRVDKNCKGCYYYDGPNTEIPCDVVTTFEELMNPHFASYRQPIQYMWTLSNLYTDDGLDNDKLTYPGRFAAYPVMSTGQVVDSTSDFTKYSYDPQYAKTNPNKMFKDFVLTVIHNATSFSRSSESNFTPVYREYVKTPQDVYQARNVDPLVEETTFSQDTLLYPKANLYNTNKYLVNLAKYLYTHSGKFGVNTHDNRAIIYTDENHRDKQINALLDRGYPYTNDPKGPMCIFSPVIMESLFINTQVKADTNGSNTLFNDNYSVFRHKGPLFFRSIVGMGNSDFKRFRIRLKNIGNIDNHDYREWTNDRSLDGDCYMAYPNIAEAIIFLNSEQSNSSYISFSDKKSYTTDLTDILYYQINTDHEVDEYYNPYMVIHGRGNSSNLEWAYHTEPKQTLSRLLALGDNVNYPMGLLSKDILVTRFTSLANIPDVIVKHALNNNLNLEYVSENIPIIRYSFPYIFGNGHIKYTNPLQLDVYVI